MAARFWVGGNANWDNTAGTKWALTTGGAGGQAVPTASDDVHLDHGTGHGNVTITISPAVCLSLNCTGYTDTLTINTGGSVNISGAVTLGSGMAVSGDGGGVMRFLVSATLTANGIVVPWTCGFQGTSQTYTLADNWHTTITLQLSGVTNLTVNGNKFTAETNLNVTTASTALGTTVYEMTGLGTTPTWKNTGNGSLKNPVTLNGNVTVDSANTIIHGSGQLKYTSGTITTTGSKLQTIASTVSSWDTNGMTWHDVTIVGGSTVTLGSNFACDGTLLHSAGVGSFSGAHDITCGAWTLSGGAGITMAMSGNITASGLLTLSCTGSNVFTGSFTIGADSATISNQNWALSGTVNITNNTTLTGAAALTNQNWNTGGLTTNGALTGTTVINFTGTGTWSGSAACSSSVVINTAGTLTMSGTILYAASGTPTLTYTAGTVVSTGSTLSIATACTLVGGTYNNLTITGSIIITINTTPVVLLGTLTLPNATVTFAGTAGLTAGTWTNAALTGTRVYVLTTGNTYQVTNSFAPTQDGTNKVSMQSSSASVPAVFTVVPGARQSVMNVISTLIDSSQGQAVYDQLGTLSQDLNWYTQYPWPGFFTF